MLQGESVISKSCLTITVSHMLLRLEYVLKYMFLKHVWQAPNSPGQPICGLLMFYRHMYSTTRIPRKGLDEVQVWKDQKHIVVFRKGVYYKLDVFKKDSEGFEVQVTIPELYAQLQQIIDMAEGKNYSTGVSC